MLLPVKGENSSDSRENYKLISKFHKRMFLRGLGEYLQLATYFPRLSIGYQAIFTVPEHCKEFTIWTSRGVLRNQNHEEVRKQIQELECIK